MLYLIVGFNLKHYCFLKLTTDIACEQDEFGIKYITLKNLIKNTVTVHKMFDCGFNHFT